MLSREAAANGRDAKDWVVGRVAPGAGADGRRKACSPTIVAPKSCLQFLFLVPRPLEKKNQECSVYVRLLPDRHIIIDVFAPPTFLASV